MDGDLLDGDVVRSQAFLDRFLAGRVGRTRSAYQVDIEDFARYVEESPASAVAKLLGELKRAFTELRHAKPKASRAESAETYLLARGYRGRA